MIKIAVAEDHQQIEGGISAIISKLTGYIVSIETVSGYALIKKLNATKQILNIAVIDVEMPTMDGLAVTYYLTRYYPDISVLVISNHSHRTIVQQIFYAGAKGYLVKENLSVDLLLAAFSEVCAGNIFIDSALRNRDFFAYAATKSRLNKTVLPVLTEKEKTFLQLSATDLSYEQIADLMNIAKETIYNYQKSLKEKLNISSRHQFMLYAIQHGIAKVALYYPPPQFTNNETASLISDEIITKE